MALYDSPGLLALFNELTGRPATDVITDAAKYARLARAEGQVIVEVAAVMPQILFQKVGTSSLPTLSTTDHNVFTFGTGVQPFGTTQIYPSLASIPDRPWIPDVDYLDEGSQIRLPRNRTYSGTLYWRGVVMPAAITSSENPHLIPDAANELTAIKAARTFAAGGNIRNPALVAEMKTTYAERFAWHCLSWKRSFSHGGALRSYTLKDLLTPL